MGLVELALALQLAQVWEEKEGGEAAERGDGIWYVPLSPDSTLPTPSLEVKPRIGLGW